MRLFKRCDHQWKEVHRDVTCPSYSFKVGAFHDPDRVDALMYGRTHIELRCTRCHDVAQRTLRGVHPK